MKSVAPKTRTVKRDKATPRCFAFTTPITEHDIVAIKDLAAGRATEVQQKVALKCIMNAISGAYDQSFVPGAQDETTFREGRSFVGQTINRFILTPLDVLVGEIT